MCNYKIVKIQNLTDVQVLSRKEHTFFYKFQCYNRDSGAMFVAKQTQLSQHPAAIESRPFCTCYTCLFKSHTKREKHVVIRCMCTHCPCGGTFVRNQLRYNRRTKHRTILILVTLLHYLWNQMETCVPFWIALAFPLKKKLFYIKIQLS